MDQGRSTSLTLDRLEALVAVCRAQSFTEAADVLHITQPALSHRIRTLEERCGMRLVVRGAAAHPTREGTVLLDYAEQVLKLVEDARRAIDDVRTESAHTRVRVAASAAWGFYLLPPALGELHHILPELAVELVIIGNSRDLVRSLLADEADIAVGIIGDLAHDPRITSYELSSDEWYMVSSPQNRQLQPLPSVPPKLLEEQCLIIREDGSATRKLLEDVLSVGRIRPALMLEFSSTEAVKKAVEHDLGVSLIAGAVIADDVANGRLNAHRLTGRSFKLPYYAATQKGRYLARRMQEFLEFLRQVKCPSLLKERG